MNPVGLHLDFVRAAAARGDHPAVIEPSGASISYRDLARVSAALRDRLVALGVARGARVGICLKKSADAVGSILGILRAGAGYVPVDPLAPAARNAAILADAGVAAVVVEDRLASGLREEFKTLNVAPAELVLDGVGGGRALEARLNAIQANHPAPPIEDANVEADDLAYILFTSGSTGRPKGVTLSHRNARVFVDWCSDIFQPTPNDRFSAHAPFHFDLSILDIYVSLKHGATLMILDEDLGKDPAALGPYIAESGITVWYSAPSILSLLAQRGRLAQYDYSKLRLVLFAGEVFPVVHLRSLQRLWPHPEYHNLYGPTETNVCTSYRLDGPVPDDRTEPYPIGKPCAHYQAIVVDADGHPAAPGGEGELCMAGPGVMRGYWNQPALTDRAFLTSPDGSRWYRTGDVVAPDENGDYRYLGRRDRMVKRRGYRVELGEIEARLYGHPAIQEAAVVALPDEELGLRLRAHLGTDEGRRLSLIQLKQFCAERLPVYMVPDQFVFHTSLPKTSTGKMDYQALKSL